MKINRRVLKQDVEAQLETLRHLNIIKKMKQEKGGNKKDGNTTK